MGAVLNLEGTWQSANIRNLPKIPRESECPGSRVRFWNSPGILSSGGRTGGSPAWSPPAQTWNTRKASSSGRGGGFRSWKRKNHAAIFLKAALPAAELSGARSTIATGCRPKSECGSSAVFSWSSRLVIYPAPPKKKGKGMATYAGPMRRLPSLSFQDRYPLGRKIHVNENLHAGGGRRGASISSARQAA